MEASALSCAPRCTSRFAAPSAATASAHPARRVLVGLSGGSDSVGLLLLLRDLAESESFALVGAAHFNHRARPAADQDEAFCRDLAAEVGLPTFGAKPTCRHWRAQQLSPSRCAHAGPAMRSSSEAAAEVGADRIAVGHTLDDQAETFLLKLARGAGATGLGGVYPRRGRRDPALARRDPRAVRAWLPESRGRHGSRTRPTPILEQPPEPCAAPCPAGARCRLRRADACPAGRCGGTGPGGRPVPGRDGRRAAAGFGPSWPGRAWSFDGPALAAEPEPILRRRALTGDARGRGGREVGLAHVELALDVLLAEAAGPMSPVAVGTSRRNAGLIPTQMGDLPRSDTLNKSSLQSGGRKHTVNSTLKSLVFWVALVVLGGLGGTSPRSTRQRPSR